VTRTGRWRVQTGFPRRRVGTRKSVSPVDQGVGIGRKLGLSMCQVFSRLMLKSY
jgi:hypothetical protein